MPLVYTGEVPGNGAVGWEQLAASLQATINAKAGIQTPAATNQLYRQGAEGLIPAGLSDDGTWLAADRPLRFSGAIPGPAGNVAYIGNGNAANNLYSNVPAGASHNWGINHGAALALDGSYLTTHKPVVFGSVGVGASTQTWIGRNTGSNMMANVPASSVMYWAVNGTSQMLLNNVGLGLNTGGASPGAQLESRSTTGPQLALSYDGTRALTIQCNSGPNIVQNITAASGAYVWFINNGNAASLDSSAFTHYKPSKWAVSLDGNNADYWVGRGASGLTLNAPTGGGVTVKNNGSVIFSANGTGWGFAGTTPAARSAGWTLANWSSSKALDASAATLDELRQVVATIINDHLNHGQFGS